MAEGTGRPKVSAVIITYNHEDFIADAIEGALMQRTDFPYEIIIGEDESQDGTREICIDYAERYPHKIRLFLRSRENVIYTNGRPTGWFNFVESLKAARAEYIALCEGDDYWTDPHKLQKQVDFLESHPESSMCFHNVTILQKGANGQAHLRYPSSQKRLWSIEDILFRNPISTCSVTFRNGLIEDWPEWTYTLPMADWLLWVLLTKKGKAGYIHEDMATYRVHPDGIWSQVDPMRRLLGTVKMYQQLDTHFDFRYHHLIWDRIAVAWGGTAAEMIEGGATPEEAQRALSTAVGRYHQWSRDSAVPSARRTQTLGHIYAGSFFASHRIHAPAMTRHCFLKAVQYDRSWLHNRGVWSILLEACMPRRIASSLRRRARAKGRGAAE